MAKSIRSEVSDSLRNRLWNAVSWHYFPHDILSQQLGKKGDYFIFIYKLYDISFKENADEISDKRYEKVLYFRELIEKRFRSLNFSGISDFLEFVIKYSYLADVNMDEFIAVCNSIFDDEKLDVHFYNGKLVQISSKGERTELEYAAKLPYEQINRHLTTALDLINNMNPSYRNSIKESISSVESLAKLITGKHNASFADAIDILSRNLGLNIALKGALEKLYGYTSSADGIRHALLEEESVQEEDARFMFMICITFVNYVHRKHDKIGSQNSTKS